jgi:hypothetical protein
LISLTRRAPLERGREDGKNKVDVSNSSAVLDGRPFHWQGGDVPLDEGVEAGYVSRVRL